MNEETAREQEHIDVRRLQAVAAPRHRPRLDGRETEPPLGIGRATPEPAEVRVERLFALLVTGMSVAAGRVGLPDLDQRIRHRPPLAVDDPPLDPHPLSP